MRAQDTGADDTSAHDDDSRAEFHRFFLQHHRELARLAYLMLGDPDSADDLAADALVAAWHRWDRVRGADQPLAYVRRMVVNMSGSRIRGLVRERNRFSLLSASAEDRTYGPDVAAVVDVRAALAKLPKRKRACVVLRLAFDLSEKETARILGVTVGTVKSQTSKAIAELEALLKTGHTDAMERLISGAAMPGERSNEGA